MNTQELRILHLEDLSSDAALAKRAISNVIDKFSIHVVETESDFISELEEFNPHIVVSDYQLPSFNGLSALKIVLEKTPLTPVIILTGSMNEDTAVECMKAGACDYVIKEHTKRLGSAILNALEQKEIKLNKIKAEEALQTSEAHFRSVFESTIMGIAFGDLNGRFIDINPAMQRILGYSIDELMRLSMAEITHADDIEKDFALFQEVLEGKHSYYQIEKRYIHKSGRVIWGNVHVSVVCKENGEPEYAIGIIDDITNRKESELLLLQKTLEIESQNKELLRLNFKYQQAKEKAEESERLKTAFLHNLSHEIRTPMNGILGFAEILKTQKMSGLKQQAVIEIIEKSGQRMLNIINDIVNISIIETGQIELELKETNLNTLLEHLNSLFIHEAEVKGLSLTVKHGLTDNICIIETDLAKITQVFSNLLKNALKFTNSGNIEFGYILNGKQLEFYVKDTGIGIVPEMHEIIFERFRQVELPANDNYGGAGLGLSISKAFVEKLGGKIWVKSKPGEGTTFYFSLPYCIAGSRQTENTSEPEMEIRLQDVTVLIADDDTISIQYLKEILEPEKVRMLFANNGQETVEIIKASPEIQIVLMDLKMPVMDGFEATKRIKKMNPCLPVVAQSAYAFSQDMEKARIAGCDDFISKPVNRELLLSLINKHISKLKVL